MPQLCSAETCTGCAACSNSCASGAITLELDSQGFPHPVINDALCTHCNLCEKNCPVLQLPIQTSNLEKPEVWACWHKKDNVRQQSSSGGAFTMLAEAILANKGVVFGAAFVDGTVRHIAIEDPTKLNSLRNSKYVQSDIGTTFREAKEFLQAKRKVLFVGCPCQISGLYAYLGRINKENLLTVDFICHGVPSPGIFADHLKLLEQKFGQQIMEFRFRDKSVGWQNQGVRSNIFLKDGTKHNINTDSFFNGFLNNLYLRDACYDCQFSAFPRIADVTIADYWGIGNHFPFSSAEAKLLGISMVLQNNQNPIFHRIKENWDQEMHTLSRPLEEVLKTQQHLGKSAKRPAQQRAFYEAYREEGYATVEKSFLRAPFAKRLRNRLIAWMGPKFISKLRNIKRTN